MVVVLLTVSIEGLLCTREVCSHVKELSGQRGCPCSFTISCSRQTPTWLMDKLLKFVVSAALSVWNCVYSTIDCIYTWNERATTVHGKYDYFCVLIQMYNCLFCVLLLSIFHLEANLHFTQCILINGILPRFW